MCGLFGLISRNNKANARFLHMLYNNHARGSDAYGITGVNPTTGEIRVFKRQGLAYNSVQKCGFVNTLPILLGHTRWSTHGSPANPLNNHPFAVGNVIGAHNGVCSNHAELGQGYDLFSECDSEPLFHLINDFKDDSDIQNFVDVVQGSFVCVWINKTKPTEVNILRGGASTVLSLVEVAGVGLMYSSEAEHLPYFATDKSKKIIIPTYSLTTINTLKLKISTREFKEPKRVVYSTREWYDIDGQYEVPSFYDCNQKCYVTYDGIPIPKEKSLDGRYDKGWKGRKGYKKGADEYGPF